MTQPFKDHFSDRAAGYASHRPSYPQALVDCLASHAPGRNLAWDCGCGSGQMSLPLGAAFDRVIATDASNEQIAHAAPHPHVEYRHAPSEKSELADASVDLIVAAQAAHWFDLPAFYREVERVAKPKAAIALVTYDWLEVNGRVDAVVRRFYSQMARYWPPERRMVEDGYRSLDFPFAEIEIPEFTMTAHWTPDQLLGYISTWSAVRALERTVGKEQFIRFGNDLREAWDGDVSRDVRWRLATRVGRIG